MRKFLYLILFVMTLCVFCCSCSQKTNDVKKTSSQHEKKLKNVPNNNTKEDVISEEDLEKGYDLPVSAQENEEATRDSMQIMSGLEHIYRNADKGDSLNVVLDNKSICKMIKKIKQQGYSVTVSEDYSNMENYKRFSSFLAKAQKKQKGSGVIYEVHSEGSIGREKFIYDGKEMFLLASNASWDDNGKPIITFVSYTRIKKWRYSRKGWFCYELCVPEYPEVTEMVDGSCLIRIKPMSDNKRKLSRKCVRGLAYQGNNILCSNWDQEHMQKIDYNDQKVLDSLGTGRTDGVFQLESGGMKGFMKELKPHSLEDVIAGISLYRPGPMDFIPQYIRGKNRPDTIHYDCPQLEPILKATHGCIVYQEQVMQIVQSLAGFTLGRSDLLRRAMSKKKLNVMEKERQAFVYGNEAEGVPGCIKNGIDEKIANKIYDEMIDFAQYAFNKSHAAAYAYVTYQTAFLKYYYPVEYMAALMTSVIDKPTKVAEYIQVCRQMNIPILPPDINKGEYGFSVSGGSILYALSAIKSVGRPVIEAIVAERKEHGEYLSVKNFIERNIEAVNKRAIENFIKAGALDCLEGNRHQKMVVFGQIVDDISRNKKQSMAGQLSLFDIASEDEKKEFEIRMPNLE